MRNILTLIFLFISFSLIGQDEKKNNIFKEVYKDFLKYGTVYIAGDVNNPQTEIKEYFVRTDPQDFYGIPEVIDQTTYHPYDYRFGFGIRKLARFGYESKPGNFWTGDADVEKQTALSAPTSAVKGLEYLLHWEKERQNGDEFTNRRLFIRHTGDYHIIKLEDRESGNVGFQYSSAEVRARLPIGKKFSISAGAIYRTHQQAYGYNPIEIWLNETGVDEFGQEYTANPWYSLGFEYGYDDWYYQSNDEQGNSRADWYWTDPDGNIVAWTDTQFRDEVFGDLMNRFNNEAYAEIDAFGEVAPIVGFDFYHYKSKFWLHAYGNWILPYHKYLTGDEDVSYLNRNNWGKGGLIQDAGLEQWSDYQAGLMFGWKVSKSIGVFIEGEYTKFWDSKIYNSSVGLNFTFK